MRPVDDTENGESSSRGSQPGTPLLAYVLCANPRCGFHEAFADLRHRPPVCPRCGSAIIAECPTCQMLLRAPTPLCGNCGRPVTKEIVGRSRSQAP